MKLTGFWLLVALTASKFSPLAHGQILDVFHSFQGTDGATPYVGLLQGSDGNFYGATFHGGTNNYGTVFKLSSDGTQTTLVTFNNSGNGAYAYTVQYTDTLTSSKQQNDLTSTNGEGSMATVTVTDSILNNLSRYYRLARHPAP